MFKDLKKCILVAVIGLVLAMAPLSASAAIVDSKGYSSLSSALAKVGSSGTLVLTSNLSTSGTTTIPATVSVSVLKGGTFTKSSGKLAILGYFDAGLNQVFSGYSAGDVTGLKEVRPEWFGGTGDGSDISTAMLNALSVISSSGGGMLLSKGIYYAPNGVNFYNITNESNNTYRIKGVGAKESIIKTHNATVSLDLGGRNRVVLEDIGIVDDGTTAAVGIARYREESQGADGGGSYHIYRNLYMEGKWSKAAIYSIAAEVNDHYSLEIHQNGNGAGYATGPTNFLSATLAGTPRVGYTSNTVNNFYGGSIFGAPSTSGGAIYISTGITDNLNFYGTYIVGYSGGYIVKLGTNSADSMQGHVVFDGVRFEGTTDSFTITGQNVWGLKITESTFGQNPGADINWTNTGLTGAGLLNSVIENNLHYDRGMTIPVITESKLIIPGTSVYHGTTVTINENVSNSFLQGDHITLGGSCYVYASVIITSDASAGTYRVYYGPNTKTSAGNAQGAVVVNKPFGTSPTGPEDGTIATAGVSNWDPSNISAATDFPAFYNGTAWVPMLPIAGTPATATSTGTKGTIAFDTSYIYICTATNTWKRVAIGAW